MIPVPFPTTSELGASNIKPFLIDCLRAAVESLCSSGGEVLEVLNLVRFHLTGKPILFTEARAAALCSLDSLPEEARLNYPPFADRPIAGTLLHDQAVPSRPFCYTCSRDLFDAMGADHGANAAWACRVRVPKSCMKCRPICTDANSVFPTTLSTFGELRQPDNYEVLTLRMVEEEYLAYTTNCELKAAKENRALHLAVTQLWSRSERVCAARLGFIQLLPSVVTLQQTPAFVALPSFTGHWLCSNLFRFFLGAFIARDLVKAYSARTELRLTLPSYGSLGGAMYHVVRQLLRVSWPYLLFGLSHCLRSIKPMLSVPITFKHGKSYCHATQWYVDTQSSSSKQPVAHLAPEHPTVTQEALCEENGGAGETRICPHTPEDLEVIGGQGNLNPQSIEQVLVPDMTVDGRHLVAAESCLWHTAPSVGNVVCFSPSAAANVVIAQKERIGGPSVPTAPQKFDPNPADLARMWACVNVVKRRMLTQQAINEVLARYGDVTGCGGSKYGESEMQRMVNDILGDVVPVGVTTNFVKLETTIKPNKAPRLVQDNSPFGFTLAALVVKVFEDVLGSYDKPLSIKKRRRDEVLDSITEDFSEAMVQAGLSGRSGAFVRKIMDSAMILENDMTTFEYTQNAVLQEGVDCKDTAEFLAHSKGFLTFELDIMKHIADRISSSIDQLNKIREEKDGPAAKKGRQKFSMRARASPYFASADFWSLTLDFLVRRSGDAQTSVGNRFCSLLAMACAFLKNPADLFNRLVDVHHEPLASQRSAINWLFEPRVRPVGSTLSRPLVLWMPRCEGDDFCGLFAGWGDTSPTAQFLAEGEACLRTWGLLPKFVPVTAGRAEFVGAHFLVERGFLRPGLWTSDLARSLTKAAFVTSDVLRPENGGCYALALAYFARAVGMRGRVDPAAAYLDALGRHYWAKAQLECPSSKLGVRVDWSLATILGCEYGGLMQADEMLRRLTDTTVQLPEAAQLELAEASLGGQITAAEWAQWSGASAGVEPDDEGRLVLGDWPAALRAKCEATWK